MINKSTLSHHCDRAYALTELLEATYEQAHSALNEGTTDAIGVLKRLKNLLHSAHELADGPTVSMNELYIKAHEDEKSDGHTPVADAAITPSTPIRFLGLDGFTLSALAVAGIHTVGKLTSMTERSLRGAMPLSPVGVDVIKERLTAHGLSLAEDRP